MQYYEIEQGDDSHKSQRTTKRTIFNLARHKDKFFNTDSCFLEESIHGERSSLFEEAREFRKKLLGFSPRHGLSSFATNLE